MILHVSLRSSNGVRGTLSKSAAVHLHLHKMLLLRAFVLLHVVEMVVGGLLVVSVLDAFVVVVCFDGDSIGLDFVLVRLDIDFSLPGLLVLAQQRLDDDWLCCTCNELLRAGFCLQFLWQWRHTDNLSSFCFVTGLERTVICCW